MLLRVTVPVGVTRVGRALETVNPGAEVEGRERYDDTDVEVDSSWVVQGSLDAVEAALLPNEVGVVLDKLRAVVVV